MSKPARAPLLADRFLASNADMAEAYLQRPYLDSLRRKVRAARKFRFDENAAMRIGHVVRDIPDLLVREHEFARAPFDLTWIEYPFWVFWDAVGNNPTYKDGTCDHTLGYLIDGNVVTVVVGGTVDEPHLGPVPGILHYHINTPWPADQMDDFLRAGNSTLEGLDAYLWGSTADRLTPAALVHLRERYMVSIAPIRKDYSFDATRRMLHAGFNGSIGEMRNIIAMLLMLNRPTITRHVNTPPTTRGFIKGKVAPYMTHTNVTIDLDAVPVMRLIGTRAGDAVPRRRHEVRGHFCHDHEARDYAAIAGCTHDWVGVSENWTPLGKDFPLGDVNHWLCAECGGKRWWKAAHERGDATIGYASHIDYDITSKEPNR